MQTALIDDTPQARTLRAYTILHHLRPNWGGSLILSIGLNPQGAALAMAANVVGAVCLSLEQDPTIAREALRSGACDFVVNTLDEALRAMKNEVRKHQPLSVGLQGNLSEILKELLERGVAPQLATDLTGAATHNEALRTLQSQGTQILNFSPHPSPPGTLDANQLLEAFLKDHQWSSHTFPFPDRESLRHFDTTAITLLTEDDHLRRTWLNIAPRLFPRERPPTRVLWLTAAEKISLQKKLASDDARQ